LASADRESGNGTMGAIAPAAGGIKDSASNILYKNANKQ